MLKMSNIAIRMRLNISYPGDKPTLRKILQVIGASLLHTEITAMVWQPVDAEYDQSSRTYWCPATPNGPRRDRILSMCSVL